MKYFVIAMILVVSVRATAQTIVGTWQLTNEKTCFQAEMKTSDTERELLKDMSGSSATSVAKLIRFDKKGSGEEGVFSVGKKKAAGMSSFNYKVNGQDLMFLDLKSGVMTKRLVIDTLSSSKLVIHDGEKDCETKTFLRIK